MRHKRFVLALFLSGVFPAALSLAQRPQDPWVYGDNNVWDASWNRRPYPSAGACFFKNAKYEGDHFCVRRGDRLSRLPGNFGDNISSIKLIGNSRVAVFNDREFKGG